MTDLCATFRWEAGVVWNRMHKAAQLGLSLSEETVTEFSLYDIAVAHQAKDIVITLATKPAEKKHGADWEWWLVHGTQGIGFRVQAKRLFGDGRYRSLLKSGSKPYHQLDTLVWASQSEGLEPLYAFYNFSHPDLQFLDPNSCEHSYRGPSFWGCTLAFPDQVKAVQSDAVSKLRHVMRPWHTLVCQANNIGLLRAAGSFLREGGRPDLAGEPRELPSRVSRLLDMRRRLRVADDPRYLDEAFWADEGDASDFNLAGLFVMRDLGERG